jgi:HEAT repeat protein
MSTEGPKNKARTLVDSILKKQPSAPVEGSQGDSAPPAPESPYSEDVAQLITLYFDLEEPEERDEVFAQISDSQSPLASDFLEAMLNTDADPYIRSAAAAKLALSGHREAVAILGEDLQDPEELFFFDQAARVLGEIIGPPFLTTLTALWNDPTRAPAQRQRAMLAMEDIDAPRACTESLEFLRSIESLVHFPEEELSAAALLFARHDFTDALLELERLETLAETTPGSPEERAEQRAFFQEARSLLLPDSP